MKILEVNSVYHYGSTGKIVENLQEYLLNQGSDVCAVYGRKRNNKYQARYIGNVLVLVYDILMSLLFDRHGLNNRKGTHKLIKVIEELNPDIIHFHNIHGFYLSYDLLLDYLSSTNKQIVITLHDCWLFTGFCSHFDKLNCHNWINDECKGCQYKKVYPYRFVSLNSHENYQLKKNKLLAIPNLTLVSPSNWMNEKIEKSFLKNIRHTVINNGISIEKFYPEKIMDVEKFKQNLKVKDKKILLGVANVWDKNKGIQDFVKLSTLISDEYVIILVGVNSLQKMKLSSKIVSVNRTTSSAELRMFYSASEFLINLSYQESFGLTCVESLACGTPIISYNVGGSSEIIGDCGYILNKGNYKEIPKILAEKGKNDFVNCVNQAKLFTRENMLFSYSELFKKLMMQI